MTTDLDQRVTQLEADMEATQAILRQLAESQVRTEQSLDRLTERVDRMSERVDSFAFEARRVLGNQGDRLSRIEAAVETLAATAQRHDRNAEADRAESRAFRVEMQSVTSRLDALVHYLMNQR